MTRMLKRKIHPDLGVKINMDNNQNTKPKVAYKDGKIYESISLLQSQGTYILISFQYRKQNFI